jgi:hypothetical protein
MKFVRKEFFMPTGWSVKVDDIQLVLLGDFVYLRNNVVGNIAVFVLFSPITRNRQAEYNARFGRQISKIIYSMRLLPHHHLPQSISSEVSPH